MNLKLLFLCLFLAVLIIPAELKNRKHKRKKEDKSQDRLDRKRGRFKDIIEDIFFQILASHEDSDDDDDDDDDDDTTEWVFELQEPEGECNPNPCLHNGICKEKGKRKFKCDCPKPFKGKKCQKGRKVCKMGKCGRGECVLTSTAPFYECKCKEPFQPPRCITKALCEPNPCKNGGRCIKEGDDFDCECPPGYRGRFCHVGPNDCYMDDGESYRGTVSETDNGHECLHWNSHFILDKGTDPFNSFEDPDGLGHHNFCRNPDGDTEPWCFYRRGHKLLWDYCYVTECPEPTGIPTTQEPTTKATPSEKPSEAPEVPDITDAPTAAPDVTDAPTAAPDVTDAPTAAPDVTDAPTAAPDVTDAPTTAPDVTDAPTAAACVTDAPTAAPGVTDAPTAGTDDTHTPTAAPDVTDAPTAAADVTVAPTAAADVTEAPSQVPAIIEPEQFSTCGKPQPKKAITRIYGGLKVPPGALPWQVSLQVRQKGSNAPYSHTCGGVLIESCWVLTAAHCMDPNKDMQVVVGGLSLSAEDPTEQTLAVKQAIIHADYRETSFSVSNDIALLKLEGTNGVCANETQFVKTACLPDAQLPDGTECTISGWGATEESEYGSNHLLDAKVLLINQETCSDSKVYGNILDESMFCAGYLQGGVDSCQGDSGGPLTCAQNNTQVIYGLVSWGDKCGRKNKPGVYTRVTHFVDWIKSNIAASP